MFPKFLRVTFWRAVLLIVLSSGLYSTFVRFSSGLGASTALTDRFPWGLWIGFDVLCGVALAAGGFTISAVVYVFNIDRFKPIIRPAIVTAFSGYLLVIIALLFDLGRPYRIWHPLVMWNPRSVMFEVAWCVTLYTAVLALEFSPLLFQRLGLKTPLRLIHSITIPLVMLGVILSTLHQSSLGSLYLIVPHKLHPLWYSSLLPVFFFVSAIGLGCAMTIVESFLSYRAFRKRLEIGLLADLGKVIVVTLSLYLILRVQDLMGRGVFSQAFEATYEGRMFLSEVLLGIIAPILLLSIPRVRRNHFSLFVASVLVVAGFVMNRLNVSITGMEGVLGRYFPSWAEVSVTAMIVALGFLLFGAAVKYLPVFPSEIGPRTSGVPEGLLLAPNVLRQAFFGSTTLVLGLGGVLFCAALMLGVNGLWHRAQTTPDVSFAESKPIDASQYFRMPADIAFQRGDSSPGLVTFRHSSHVASSEAACTACHSGQFSLLKKAAASGALPAAGDLHGEEFCGSCHNGEKSFSVKEDCQLCHQEEP
jgi:c(7)-type cytochrome triheme protein